MKKIISLVCILFLVVACGSNTSTMEDSLKDGVLTVGLECDYAPYNWTTIESKKSEHAVQISGSKNYCEGYDVMISKKLADYLGVKLEIKKMSWDGLIPAVNNGQIDVIIAGMSPTDERKKNIEFSNAYYKDEIDQAILVKKDSKWASNTRRDQFKGAKITAQQGTMQVEMLDQLPGIEKVAQLPDYGALMQALKADSIDGYIAEMAVATEHAAANKDFKVVVLDKDDAFELTEAQTTTAVGIKKGNLALVEKINEALKSISEDSRVEMMKKAQSLTGTKK